MRTLDPNHKLVGVHAHWEVHNQAGRCIVSGDTKQEALEAYQELFEDLETKEHPPYARCDICGAEMLANAQTCVQCDERWRK
jgi:hypothetical protein